MMTVKYAITGAILAASMAAAPAAAQDMVRIGTEGAYPPYNYTDSDGNLVGFEIALGNAMCEEMGVECEWVAQDWDGIIPALLNERYDMIMAGMSITDERRERIAFSQPYVADPAYFVAAEDSDYMSAETVEDIKAALEGASVGVQTATIHQNFIEQHLGDSVDMRLYDTQENMELDLTSGRIDAALADGAAWRAFFEREDGGGYGYFGPALTGQEYPVFGEGVGVGLRQEEEALQTMVDEALTVLKEDGTIAELSREYFSGEDITVY
ncbi:MAG: transporter substrate-binding domain-containing protein [Azospirillaceae bacterium]